MPDGVEAVRGDLTAPDTLHAALDGVESVFLIWPLLTTEHAPVLVEAVAKRVRRIVYLSAPAGSRRTPWGGPSRSVPRGSCAGRTGRPPDH